MSTTISSELVQTVLQLAALDHEIAGEVKVKKAESAKVGEWFASLTKQFKDDEVIEGVTKTGKPTFTLQGMDLAIEQAEAVIWTQARAIDGLPKDKKGNIEASYVLPKCWTQYKSNARKFVSTGLAADWYVSDDTPIAGIGKITQATIDLSAKLKAESDPWIAALQLLKATSERIKTFSDDSIPALEKAKPGHAAQITALRNQIVMGINNLAAIVNDCCISRGIEGTQNEAKPALEVEGEQATKAARRTPRKVKQAA